ncbi:MAG TPA: hypothetical protein IAA28_08425 [Candidatus Lachnoclostridium stercoripullorum]|uniref:ABC transporter permease n=1 Tax=Candidatus Lachnoclostridium stercoripullorum TaxID=2838635 RepID=A0A9D1W6P7_9FIRM|nr:hypothetical protein [Candidatus Lachnoclostridium stercoripullorum]
MYSYTWYQWLTFFYLYCFAGWIFESAYVSILKKRLVNRGFLRLPLLPLYGTGAVMMLWVSLPFEDNLFLVYLSGVVAATILEYVTGWTMERLFKMKYWDYSDQRFNFRGYICLSSSIAWGFLTILLTEVLHPPVARLVQGIPAAADIAGVLILSVFFAEDTVQSVRDALDLGRALEAMTSMKAELDDIQVQLALLRADASDRVSEYREDAAQRLAVAREDAAQKLVGAREDAAQKLADAREDAATRVEQLKTEAMQKLGQAMYGDRMSALMARSQEIREKRLAIASLMNRRRKNLLLRNPSASSRRFGSALEDIKELLKK